MTESVQCAMCRRHVPRHESYVLRIEVLADPSTPAMDTDTNPEPGLIA